MTGAVPDVSGVDGRRAARRRVAGGGPARSPRPWSCADVRRSVDPAPVDRHARAPRDAGGARRASRRPQPSSRRPVCPPTLGTTR
ncbi:hypothetical protein ACWEFJ_23220 [Actinosynnema sp. NPDC004786]